MKQFEAPPETILRVVFCCEYDGSSYCGSQAQAGGQVSVQSVLEAAFEALAVERGGDVVLSGRTDAGVHALGQVGHVDVVAATWARLKQPLPALNSNLPDSVAIRALQMVERDARDTDGYDFHATKSARWRTYQYRVRVTPIREVFLPPNVLAVPEPLAWEAMQQAADVIVGRHDFTSFQSVKKESVDPVCEVREARWFPDGPDWVFQITANRFVYRMVRRLVGTMLLVGRGKIAPEAMNTILSARLATHSDVKAAPARGLTLLAVYYPPPWDFFCEDVYVKTVYNQVSCPRASLDDLQFDQGMF